MQQQNKCFNIEHMVHAIMLTNWYMYMLSMCPYTFNYISSFLHQDRKKEMTPGGEKITRQ